MTIIIKRVEAHKGEQNEFRHEGDKVSVGTKYISIFSVIGNIKVLKEKYNKEYFTIKEVKEWGVYG